MNAATARAVYDFFHAGARHERPLRPGRWRRTGPATLPRSRKRGGAQTGPVRLTPRAPACFLPGDEPPPRRLRRSKALSLPNILTYGRLLAVPAVVALLFWPKDDWTRWLALAIFIAAGVTDYLDGYFARLYAQQSALGRMLDPIADKLLVAACLMMLVYAGTIEDQHVLGPPSSSSAARSWSRACASSWPSSRSACR